MESTYSCDICDASFTKPSLLQRHKRTAHAQCAFSCHLCSKTFSQKFNLNRHMVRHTSDDQYECPTCRKVFSRPDNLQRHLVQHGGGKRPSTSLNNAPRKQPRLDHPRQFYDVRVINEKYMAKFKTRAKTFQVTFKDIEVEGLSDILFTLRKILASIMDDVSATMAPRDYVQLSVQCPELDFPIVVPFVRLEDLSVDLFFAEIERVLQSYEQFVLDSSLEIQIIHAAMPTGGRTKKCRYVDLEKFLKEKKCIVRITNRDNLCCARAIVTAKAKLDKHEKWASIRDGYFIQRDLALALHREANAQEGLCGIEEVKLFQSILPGYQLNLVSKDHFNAIIYCGPEAEKKIYLYHHDSHFDVITSMPAFLNRGYFCPQCLKGYNTKEKHKCNIVCGCCFKIHEEDYGGEWISCASCNGYFKGQLCFDNHRRTTDNGNSTCKNYYRCLKCTKTIKKLNREDTHRCGETFCHTCKEYVLQGHLCYMKPAKTQVRRVSSDDTEIPSFVTIEPQEEDDNAPTYIFYDFESTQDGGFHKPNLCVAFKVCETCLSDDKDTCEHCGEREHVFSGPNTRVEFCQWLFSEDNCGSTCIAHNFKGYDSYFILSYLYDNAILPKIILRGTKVMSIQVPACDMKFIDSINFLPMALSKLPGTFGIKDLCKGHFPHLYNCAANQNARLSHLPEAKYYNPESMKPKDRTKFYQWYEAHKKDEFGLQDELLKYCRSDVRILKDCCLQFRELFMSMTSSGEDDPGIDLVLYYYRFRM